jgi:hypothetical protein
MGKGFQGVPSGIELRELQSASDDAMPLDSAEPEDEAGFELTRRWLHSGHLPLAVLSGVLFAIGVVALVAALTDTPAGGVAGAALVLLVAFGIGYVAIAGLLNRTHVKVQNQILTIRHAPLPWPGTMTVAVDTLEKLYVKEEVSEGKSTTRTYDLRAMLASGSDVVLIKRMQNPAQALFLEQLLRSRLGILDVPVEDESTG